VVAITSALLPSFLYVALPLFAIIVLIRLVSTPSQKGRVGEAWVRFLAYWGLPARTYKRLHNLTLRVEDGTTQIDHVFISRYGVFVVETKHMKGRIFGAERQAQWVQKVGSRSYSFQNPLRQNYRHLKALEHCLGVDMAHLKSVVVFTGPARFKTPMPPHVVRGWRFPGYVRRFDEPVFSEAQVAGFMRTLTQRRLPPGEATDRAHIEGLQRRHGKKKQAAVRPLMLVSLLGMVVTGLIACGDKHVPLATQAAKTLQPIGQEVSTAALKWLGGTLGHGPQDHLARQAPAHGPERTLRACIKPDNLVDEDVKHCMNGTRVRDW
jgi:restriction system protein